MIILISALIVATVIISIVFFVSYSVDISQTRDSTNSYGFSNFKRFKIEYDKREWFLEYSKVFDFNYAFGAQSRWDRKDDSELHAGIMRFGGVGMILNPIDYIRAVAYIKKQTQECEDYVPQKPETNPWKGSK
jgi:hypothetical protein